MMDRFEGAYEYPADREHASLRKVEVGHVSLFGQGADRS
jgi:hypothetical protein